MISIDNRCARARTNRAHAKLPHLTGPACPLAPAAGNAVLVATCWLLSRAARVNGGAAPHYHLALLPAHACSLSTPPLLAICTFTLAAIPRNLCLRSPYKLGTSLPRSSYGTASQRRISFACCAALTSIYFDSPLDPVCAAVAELYGTRRTRVGRIACLLHFGLAGWWWRGPVCPICTTRGLPLPTATYRVILFWRAIPTFNPGG